MHREGAARKAAWQLTREHIPGTTLANETHIGPRDDAHDGGEATHLLYERTWRLNTTKTLQEGLSVTRLGSVIWPLCPC